MNVIRDAFADRLKLSAARVFFPDIAVEDAIAWCNSLKESGHIFSLSDDEAEMSYGRLGITGRVFLQHYGTEAHRDVFGHDFWTRVVLPNPVAANWGRADVDEMADFLVITDVRFPNEADHIHDCGGQVWKIDRPTVAKGDGHASEKPLAPEYLDVVIDNSGTLDDLKAHLSQALLHHYGLRWPNR